MKTFKEFLSLQEDGGAGGAAAGGSAGPASTVGSGAIAGSGGKGGEPGVDLRKKKKNPIMVPTYQRKAPQ